MNKIVVLCRGSSLSKIKILNPKEFDKVCIVNNFDSEVKDKNIEYFLSSSNNIQQYISRDRQSIMNKDTYKKFNIRSVKLNILEREYYGYYPFKQQSGNKFLLDKINIKSNCLDNNTLNFSLDKDNKKNLRQPSYPTTGVLCLVDQILNYNAKEVTVIGMDFYETDYYCKHNITNAQKTNNHQRSKGPRMKNFIKNFYENYCKEHNVKINFVTNSSFILES